MRSDVSGRDAAIPGSAIALQPAGNGCFPDGRIIAHISYSKTCTFQNLYGIVLFNPTGHI